MQVVFDVGTFELTIGSTRLDLEYLKYLENKFHYFSILPSDQKGSKSMAENKNLTKCDDMTLNF